MTIHRRIVRGYRDAFSGLPREVWVLAACLFVNRMGMMVLPFLELYLIEARGFEVGQAGVLVALYGVGAILGVLLGGRLTDRLGSRRVQLGSLLANAVLLLVLSRARGFTEIAIAVACTSLAGDAFRPANGAAIARAVGPESRARAFSLMGLAANLGVSFGLPLGGMLAAVDFAWLFRIDAATAAAAALLLWRLGSRSAQPPPERSHGSGPASSPWRDGPFLVVVLLLCLVATVLFQFFGALPVFLKLDLGLDEAEIGRCLALNTLLVALLGMPVVRWVERRADLPWLGFGAFLICAGYGINALAGGVGLALASIVVWSLGETLYFPLGAAFVARRAPPGALGRTMSAYHLTLSFALVLAPFVGTQVYERAGPTALWAGCAVVGVLVAAAFGLVHRRLEGARGSPGA